MLMEGRGLGLRNPVAGADLGKAKPVTDNSRPGGGAPSTPVPPPADCDDLLWVAS